jgi:hypothetical protein
MSVNHSASHTAFVRDAQIRLALLADLQLWGAMAWRCGVFWKGPGVGAHALFVLEPANLIRFSEMYPV